MAVFVPPKWANFNDLTRHWKLYQEFLRNTQWFSCQFVDDPTHQEVVAPAPCLVKLLLVNTDCEFYDSAPTTSHVEPLALHLPHDEPIASIATRRQFSPDAFALLTKIA
jgi:hypothetical protein